MKVSGRHKESGVRSFAGLDFLDKQHMSNWLFTSKPHIVKVFSGVAGGTARAFPFARPVAGCRPLSAPTPERGVSGKNMGSEGADDESRLQPRNCRGRQCRGLQAVLARIAG